MDQAEMRRSNADAALRALYGRDAPASLIDLMDLTGISRKTLDLLLADLTDRGWATVERPVEGGRGAGRPAKRWLFNAAARTFLAIQIEHAHIRCVLTDLRCRTLAADRVDFDADADRDARLRAIVTSVQRLFSATGTSASGVIAATLGVPGVVDDDGIVDLPSAPSWHGVRVGAMIAERAGLSCEIVTENDANLAAFAESSIVAPKGVLAFLYADSERYGLGLVIDGEIHRGFRGFAGEVPRAPALGLRDTTDPLLRGLGDAVSPHHDEAVRLVGAARAGEQDGLNAVGELVSRLSGAIEIIWAVVAPGAFVLGGTLGEIADLLVVPLRGDLADRGFPIDATVDASVLEGRSVTDGCLRVCRRSLVRRFPSALVDDLRIV